MPLQVWLLILATSGLILLAAVLFWAVESGKLDRRKHKREKTHVPARYVREER